MREVCQDYWFIFFFVRRANRDVASRTYHQPTCHGITVPKVKGKAETIANEMLEVKWK